MITRRIVLGVLLVGLLGSSCLATVPTFVRSGVNASAAANTTIAIASQVTTLGNTGIVICEMSGITGVLSVADGGTDTFVAIGSIVRSTTEGGSMQMFFVQSLAGGTKTITCTTTVSQNFRGIWYFELTGQSGSALDQNGSASSDAGGNSATPSVTLTIATDTVMVGAASCGNTCSLGTCTPNACTNGLSDANGDEAAIETNAAGGSTKIAMSQTSGTYIAVAASFNGATAGGGGAPSINKQTKLESLDGGKR